ncbi:MAG: MATE family efflux transporter [Dehalococcoidales bacterium]|nr:MATE family efflux transporter [Dehalococcoidales bacterium]
MNETTEQETGSTRAVTGRDWTQGSIPRNLVSLAWPVMINSALTSIGPIIDMIWVGKLGSASVAGVGIASMLVAVLDAFKMGLDMGTRAMIAHFVGAGDYRSANHVALQGYVVTIGFAAIVGVLGALLAGPILTVFGLSPDVVEQGAPYLRIQFIGILTMGLVRQNEGTMLFAGDTVNPMKIALVYRIFHLVLCPFLVFGWWIFPSLGTTGAAITGIISALLGAALGLWYLLSGRTRLRLDFRDFHLDGKMIWRIVKVGVPASITGIERSFGQLVLSWFIVPFGTVATAAHSIVLQVTGIINVAGSGVGQGSAILAGQNLGAKQPDRAEKSGWYGAFFYTGIMVAASIIVWFWGKYLVGIFNNEAELLIVGATFLRIQIVTYLCSGFANVLQQCINGVGDTTTTMLVVLFDMFAIQLPLAWFLSQHTGLGVYGTYWAIVIGTVVMAFIYTAYFKHGRWKQKIM